MDFEDVARAVDEILKNPMSGKGVLTVGELISDRIIGMARSEVAGLESGEVVSLKRERKKRQPKTHKEVMEEAVAPLDESAPDSPF